MHAPIAIAAMRMGKSVYVEKPMAHSKDSLRQTKAWIEAGVIGTVKEVHGWSGRPGNFWKQDMYRPTEDMAAPANLDWNLWLGAARMVRFRHRRIRRYGGAQSRSRFLCARSGCADGSLGRCR